MVNALQLLARLGILCLVGGALSVQADDGTSVVVRAPYGLSCSLKSAVRVAFERRFKAPQPQVQVVSSRGLAVVEIWRKNRPELTRELGHSHSCRVLAETAALVVSRFMEDFAWNGTIPALPQRQESTPPLTQPEPESSMPTPLGTVIPSLPSPAASSPLVPDAGLVAELDGGSTPLAPPSREETAGSVESLDLKPNHPGLALGAQGWFAVPQAGTLTATVAPSIELFASFGQFLRLALGVTIPVPSVLAVSIQNRERGTLSVLSILTTLKATGVWKLDRVDVCAGLEGGALVTRAWASGSLFNVANALDAAPAVGLLGRGAWRLPLGFALFAEIRPLFLPLSTEYVVEGTATHFRTPMFLLLVGAGVEWTL